MSTRSSIGRNTNAHKRRIASALVGESPVGHVADVRWDRSHDSMLEKVAKDAVTSTFAVLRIPLAPPSRTLRFAGLYGNRNDNYLQLCAPCCIMQVKRGDTSANEFAAPRSAACGRPCPSATSGSVGKRQSF